MCNFIVFFLHLTNQIARTKQGQPGGYALVDYTTVQAAERGQTKLDGKRLWDSNIRISFSTPGKTAQSLIAKQEDMVREKFNGNLLTYIDIMF